MPAAGSDRGARARQIEARAASGFYSSYVPLLAVLQRFRAVSPGGSEGAEAKSSRNCGHRRHHLFCIVVCGEEPATPGEHEYSTGPGLEEPPGSARRAGNGRASTTTVDDVSLYLPTGSRTGTYDIGVFEEPGTPLVSATGMATAEGTLTVLKAKLDLSKLNPGHYLLAIRPPGVDWSYYPLVVR